MKPIRANGANASYVNKMAEPCERPCTGCKNRTKYVCIICETPICNRKDCCLPENDDSLNGWIAQRSVAYCKDCGDENIGQPGSDRGRKRMHENSQGKLHDENDDVDSSSNESDLEFEKPKRKAAKKRKGRKGSWKESHVDDIIDIIVNSESYKKKLIFTNVKKQKNSEVYDSILLELTQRYSEHTPPTHFPFNVKQMRTKFKWCVSTCKKISMTIRTATGIKRIQDEKGFGKWFDLLYPLIKSRDSCQPEQAIEPEPITLSESEAGSTSGTGESLFVPLKGGNTKKKDKTTELLLESVQSLKKVIETDPTKDILNLMREDMKQAREQDMQFQQMMLTVLQQPSGVPQQPSTVPLQPSVVPLQPSGEYHPNQSAHSWPANTYSTYGKVNQPHFVHGYGITPNATVKPASSTSSACQSSTSPNFSSFIEDEFSHKRFEQL